MLIPFDVAFAPLDAKTERPAKRIIGGRVFEESGTLLGRGAWLQDDEAR